MKKLLAILFVCCISTTTYSQENKGLQHYSLAYFSPFGIQPGVKVGTDFSIKAFDKEFSKTDSMQVRHHMLLLSPEIGFFSRRLDFMAFLANAELGWQLQREGRKTWNTFSLGLGYLEHSEVTSTTVNLSGEVVSKERARQGYFLPTLNYEKGWQFKPQLGGYVKAGLGYKLAPELETSGILLLELGMRFTPKPTE